VYVCVGLLLGGCFFIGNMNSDKCLRGLKKVY